MGGHCEKSASRPAGGSTGRPPAHSENARTLRCFGGCTQAGDVQESALLLLLRTRPRRARAPGARSAAALPGREQLQSRRGPRRQLNRRRPPPPQACPAHTVQGSAGAPAAELTRATAGRSAWSLSLPRGGGFGREKGSVGGVGETGGRAWDRDIALGWRCPPRRRDAAGATPATPEEHLLGRRRRMSGAARPKAACRCPVQCPVPPRSVQPRPRTAPHPPPRRLPPARAPRPQLPRASGAR